MRRGWADWRTPAGAARPQRQRATRKPGGGIWRGGETMAAFDCAIRGGRIVDGTGNPWYRADVGIKDGRIVSIGRVDASDAARTIEADGRVVCPGFIDMHTHSDVPLLKDGD